MQKAFKSVSAALDKNKFKELGWQCFQGPAKEFKELQGTILKAGGFIKKEYVGQMAISSLQKNTMVVRCKKFLKVFLLL